MENSESKLIRQFKEGDQAAANELIEKYYSRVVSAAKRRLDGMRIRVSSEDDIAASVFESLWQRASEQRFDEEDLANPEELWKLLCTLVRFKTRDHARREKAQKRGGNQLRGESVFVNAAGEGPGIDQAAISEESISKLVGFRDQHEHLMNLLGDEALCEVATLRLEGYKVREIAERLSVSERSTKRKLALIRDLWADQIDPETD